MTRISKQILKNNHSKRPGGNYTNNSITIHSTANPRSTAQNERDWLDNPSNKRNASWHYVIDETSIIQAIPEAEEAWHCGKRKGNRSSIGIEICESGNRRKTLENAAEFVAGKLKGFGWGVDKLKKHFDWTGKNCPRILIDTSCVKDGLDWDWFVERVKSYLEDEKEMGKRYQNIDEVPSWGKATVQKLIAKGGFADKKKLNLTEDMLRQFVISDRVGAYK